MSECLVPDFFDLDRFDADWRGYEACFCAGMSEATYTSLPYDLTLRFAEKLAALNPAMVFTYVSGRHTDSFERGRMMWARVKGRTENAFQRLSFRAVCSFRPGFTRPTLGPRNLKWYFKALGALYPAVHACLPNYAGTLSDLGCAMIRCVQQGYPKPILETQYINALAATRD